MMHIELRHPPSAAAPCTARSEYPRERLGAGFTLVELMVAITLSLLVVLALIAVFLNVSRTNSEMARTNSQIENGRFAMQLLQGDISHAGFWGTYVPQFDNLSISAAPTDTPLVVPDPCAPWNADINGLIGVPLQPLPAGHTCATTGPGAVIVDRMANTDALVVRHAATCVPTAGAVPGDCEPWDANKVYFQASLCSAAAQLGSTSLNIILAANASSDNTAYVGRTIRLLSGTGQGQQSIVQSYDGSTKIATVLPAWAITPDASTNYSIDAVDRVLGTGAAVLNLTARNCATAADMRKFISKIYYIRTWAATPGDGIPTLVRSQFDFAGGALAHQPPVALIEGIEGFRIQYQADNQSITLATVNTASYLQPINWSIPDDHRNPTNRGDGNADSACVAATCTIDDLRNVVAARVHILARAREASPGHTDTKTYALGDTTLGPFNDAFKRHVFSTAVRMANVSGRRETPP
jgi:type IV pilus assembly protein PilW